MSSQERGQTLTVCQVNQAIALALESSFPAPFWVVGEIQGFDRDLSKANQRRWGQVYFELIEKEGNADSVKACIKSVLWGQAREEIERKLKQTSPDLKLQDGIQVKLLCSVDFWWPRAALQLKVLDVDPSFTLGDMERARQELIQFLKDQNLLDKNRAIPFPVAPQVLGLVTSEGSAAYHDFVEELRHSGYSFQIKLWDGRMQGEETEKSVCRGIKELDALPEIDVILIVRGGGSRSDLIWFDKRAIALAIAGCSKPVITGIGHEIDLSVADLTAYEYRKTPTAVAQFLVEKVRQFETEMREDGTRVISLGKELLNERRRDLTQSFHLWQKSSALLLGRVGSDLSRTVHGLSAAAVRSLALERQKFSRFPADLCRNALSVIRRDGERLDAFQKECVLKDPRRVLERGYSLIRSKGRIVKSVQDVSAGDDVQAQLRDGSVSARVTAKTSNDSNPC